MTFVLFLAAMAALALFSTTKEQREAARREANRKYAWLWIPTALIWLALLWPQ